jgi:hypothetical protein
MAIEIGASARRRKTPQRKQDDSTKPELRTFRLLWQSSIVIKLFLWIRRTAQLDLKLSPELDAALAREARRARKPKAAVLLRAVESYLEERADTRAVHAARRQGGRPIAWSEVKRRHGLAG